MRSYVTRYDAVQTEIVEPIGVSPAVEDPFREYDIEAIADETIGTDGGGCYYMMADAELFWRIVEMYERSE